MRNTKTREGYEFWDKLNALPRYAFLLSPSGKTVQKFEDKALGNWIDVHEAQKVVDHAQEDFNVLKSDFDAAQSELAALREELAEQSARLVCACIQREAAEQRNAELMQALEGMVEYFPEGHSDGECFSVEKAKAALNPTESGASE